VSKQTANTIVLLAGGLMFAAIAIKRATIPDPFRFAWAAGVITLGLSVLADISPEVAGPAAILVLLAVYTRNKGVLGSVLPSGVNVNPATNPQAAGPPAPTH
jgi:hypothetical protein